METMYNEDGNMDRMRRYQEILSFLLGCVENQVVPDKSTVSIHLYDTVVMEALSIRSPS